jgi:CRISPR system Cascade subunit CasE
VAQQEDWLLSRQERAGFRILRAMGGGSAATPGDEKQADIWDLVVSDRRTVSFSRRETRVTLRIATFEGTLVVTDRDLFAYSLGHGIGRAKGYGCGLMTIAPVR